MNDDAEVARLSAGRPPARPEDDEISRILAGAPPAPLAVADDIATLSATSPALRAVAVSDWEPSTLTGSRVVRIGRGRFMIPRNAQTKHSRRAGTIWVRLDSGEVYILSELGQLRQTAAERRATRWDLL